MVEGKSPKLKTKTISTEELIRENRANMTNTELDQSIITRCTEAGIQFLNFDPFTKSTVHKHRNLEELGKLKKMMEGLQNLEIYAEIPGNMLDSFDMAYPGIRNKYNSLILELKNPNLTYKQFDDIIKRAGKFIFKS